MAENVAGAAGAVSYVGSCIGQAMNMRDHVERCGLDSGAFIRHVYEALNEMTTPAPITGGMNFAVSTAEFLDLSANTLSAGAVKRDSGRKV